MVTQSEAAWAKRRAQQAARTCKHCGAVTGGSRCGCPEAIAQLKADAAASAKKVQEDNAHHARFEKERADERRKADEAQAKDMRQMFDAGRKEVQRDQLDTHLRDREQAVKHREITRREKRHDNYDAEALAEAADLTAVEPDWDTFDSMTMDVVRPIIDRPEALLTRTDGRLLLYAGKVNTVAARPNGGKSWLALKCAVEVVQRGGRVLMLDFDNKRPGILAGRARDMAVEATVQNKDYFLFKDTELVSHPGAMAAAVRWLLAAKAPTYSCVMIDSDTASGVPVDGSDALPWWETHVTPWEAAELGVLILSHRGKDEDEENPLAGPMGPTAKRALPTGAVLIMKTYKMWNSEVGGLVHLVVDKDRAGALPGVERDTIVDMVVEHVDMGDSKFLNITLEPPDAERGSGDLAEELDAALMNHPEGVYSQKAVRALVKGNGKAIGIALKSLIDAARVIAEKVEGKRGYLYKSSIFKD